MVLRSVAYFLLAGLLEIGGRISRVGGIIWAGHSACAGHYRYS
jgi:hypothetical protein